MNWYRSFLIIHRFVQKNFHSITVKCWTMLCLTFDKTICQFIDELSDIVHFQRNVTSKCDIPPTAPKKIEEVINQCQDEIKIAILAGEYIQIVPSDFFLSGLL